MDGAISAHQEQVGLHLLKHQIQLTVGLIKQQLISDDDPNSSFHNTDHKNVLLSPHLLVYSLASLLTGSESDTRVQLARTLLCHKIDRLNVNDYVTIYGKNNQKGLKKNSKSLQMVTFQYRKPSCPIENHSESRDDESRNDKLWKNYQCKSRNLQLLNDDENPSLKALAIINQDFHESEDKNHMLSTPDYISLINGSIETLLVNSVDFKSLWSKEFELKYGEFHKSNGESVKTELLYKKKPFLYYEDAQSNSSAIKINFSHDGSASMVLILPDENITIQRFLHKLFDFEALKRILDSLTTLFEVRLTLPKFAFQAKVNMTRPLQRIRTLLPALNKDHDVISSIDEKVVLVQRLSIEVDERGVDSKQGFMSKLIAHDGAKFKADRPFLFLIVTNEFHKQILFAGVCNDPTQECV